MMSIIIQKWLAWMHASLVVTANKPRGTCIKVGANADLKLEAARVYILLWRSAGYQQRQDEDSRCGYSFTWRNCGDSFR